MKATFAFGCSFLMSTGGQNHGRKRHGNIVFELREFLFRHYGPGRAAAGRHERLLFRNFVQEVFGFFNRAQVGTDGDFNNIREIRLPSAPQRLFPE